jgi:hypothetical protein
MSNHFDGIAQAEKEKVQFRHVGILSLCIALRASEPVL